MMVMAFGKSTEIHLEDEARITERSALHKLEWCLKNGKDYTVSSFLDKKNHTSICEMCGICITGRGARIEDFQGNAWEFGTYTRPRTDEEGESAYINIKEGDRVIVAKMTLRL